MSKAIIIAPIAAFALACGPRVDEEEDPPGELVYEDSFRRLHRLDRRVEVTYLLEREDGLDGECGILTDRAYEELESTLAALDPTVDYGYDPEILDCVRSPAWVHIDGFEHSPFQCGVSCCHPDLHWMVFVYTMIFTNFDGGHPTVEGEPYVAIEPDQSCP